MSLKLNVGIVRKVGLPGYSSAGATCHIELELDPALLDRDPDAFRARVRDAYDAARRAVDDELGRLRADRPDHPAPEQADGDASGPHWPATTRQLGALAALARRRGADLGELLPADFGVDRPEDLSSAQAGRLIEALQAPASV